MYWPRVTMTSSVHQVMFWENDVKKVCMVFSDWLKLTTACRLAIAHNKTQLPDCQMFRLYNPTETVTETFKTNKTSFSLSSRVGSASVRPPP